MSDETYTPDDAEETMPDEGVTSSHGKQRITVDTSNDIVRHQLRGMYQSWFLDYASSGQAALGMAKKFVLDLRLPGSFEEVFPGMPVEEVVILAMALALFFFVDLFEEKRQLRESLASRTFGVRWLSYAFLLAAILCLGKFGIDMTGGFAYAQY